MLKEIESGKLAIVLNNPAPFAFEFGTSNCSDCKRLSTVVERVADSLRGKIDVYYVDTGKVPEITDKYQVRELPAMILFKDGEPKDRLTGFHSEEEVRSFLTQ